MTTKEIYPNNENKFFLHSPVEMLLKPSTLTNSHRGEEIFLAKIMKGGVKEERL